MYPADKEHVIAMGAKSLLILPQSQISDEVASSRQQYDHALQLNCKY